MILAASISERSALWYLTRGTGIVALLLLTAVIVLGVLGPARISTGPHFPRFTIVALHRDLSLLAVLVILIHVVVAVVDGFAPIGLLDAIVPFISAYRPVWLGLGALAFDLMLAVVLTSAVRHRLGYRAWRLVHWLSYASWPVAVLHGLGTGSDAAALWALAITYACIVAVAVASVVRVLREEGIPMGWRPFVVAATVTASIAVPAGVAVFTAVGPLSAHWAARAGTPTDLLGSSDTGASR